MESPGTGTDPFPARFTKSSLTAFFCRYSYYSLYLFANGYDRFDDFNDHLHEFLYVNEDGKNFQSDVACVASGDNPCASVEAARYFIWNKTENLTTKQFEFAELVNAKIATYLPNTRSFVYTDEWLYAYTDSQMYAERALRGAKRALRRARPTRASEASAKKSEADPSERSER